MLRYLLTVASLWALVIIAAFGVVRATAPQRAAQDAEIVAHKSEQRMRALRSKDLLVVGRKCSLDVRNRIYELLRRESPANPPEAGLLIPFADITAYYDGVEWWCSGGKP